MTKSDKQNEAAKKVLDSLKEMFCHHLVSIVWVDVADDPKHPGDRDHQAKSISAFVISVRGVWFLVTAGHVFQDM